MDKEVMGEMLNIQRLSQEDFEQLKNVSTPFRDKHGEYYKTMNSEGQMIKVRCK